MNKKRGFTLIEVLIATAIMVSVLGALVVGLSQCASLSETAHNGDIALNAAQDKLEEIANNVSQIWTFSNQAFPVEDAQGNPLLTAPSGQATPGRVSLNYLWPSALVEVNVTVTWQQRGGKQISRSLSTILVQK